MERKHKHFMTYYEIVYLRIVMKLDRLIIIEKAEMFIMYYFLYRKVKMRIIKISQTIVSSLYFVDKVYTDVLSTISNNLWSQTECTRLLIMFLCKNPSVEGNFFISYKM